MASVLIGSDFELLQGRQGTYNYHKKRKLHSYFPDNYNKNYN